VPIRPPVEKQDTGAETTRLLMDEYEAQLIDIRRNGETAISTGCKDKCC